jgi:hypothetical protein
MTRRGGQSWGGGSRGMYDGGRRSPYGQLAGIAGVLLGLVVLGFIIFTRVLGGNCSSEYCESNRSLAAPQGYELVTKVYEYNSKRGAIAGGTDVRLGFPLAKSTTDNRNLSFYRYDQDSNSWVPLAPAVLDPAAKQVTGLLKEAPTVVAVMRRLSAAGTVVAYLERNARLHLEAASQVTVVHTLDLKPTADGGIAGDLSTLQFAPGQAWYPVISANAADRDILLVESILSNSGNRSNHVQQIVNKVTTSNLAGVDIAYLDLRADQRTSFTLFVAELAQQLHSRGKILTLTLPPPTRTQDRVDEGAYDWTELGKAADLLKIAPYRDQSTYRRDMPIILTHLTSIVPQSKLVLTVTPYASEKSPDGVRRISLTQAMSIATRMRVEVNSGETLSTNSNVRVVGVNIDRDENMTGMVWDAASATVAFTYKSATGEGGRTIWLENFFSTSFKLEFITRYSLGGVAIEDASDNVYLGNIWTALTPFINSGQPVLLQPNPTDLLPKWRASKGSIEEGQPGRGSVKWVTPAEPGTYTVTLTLSDGVALFESEIAVNVQQRDTRAPSSSGTPSGSGTPSANPTPIG